MASGNLASYAWNTKSSAFALPSALFCRNAPAAKLRGLGEISRYFASNIVLRITTSPRTWTSISTPSDSGTLSTLRALRVTSSPRAPLPRVAALTKRPLRYSRDRAEPSNLG